MLLSWSVSPILFVTTCELIRCSSGDKDRTEKSLLQTLLDCCKGRPAPRDPAAKPTISGGGLGRHPSHDLAPHCSSGDVNAFHSCEVVTRPFHCLAESKPYITLPFHSSTTPSLSINAFLTPPRQIHQVNFHLQTPPTTTYLPPSSKNVHLPIFNISVGHGPSWRRIGNGENSERNTRTKRPTRCVE